jgi:photosystem I subunit 11
MTVTPVADPTVGNLATPVNSNAFTKAFLNGLPAYRPALSPNRRGLEIGMAHGFDPHGLPVDLRHRRQWTECPAR